MITEWMTAIGTVSAAVVALGLALFHAQISKLLFRPKLNISIETKPPDCNLSTITNTQTMFQSPAYYFRLSISNEGNAPARDVEVFVKEILRRRADGTFELWSEFLPLNLLWSHYLQVYFPKIPPKIAKHCELGHIIEPANRNQFPGETSPNVTVGSNDTALCLELVVRPSTGTFLVTKGVCRIVIVAVSENAKAVTRTFEVNLTGDWYPTEDRMLRDGIGIAIV